MRGGPVVPERDVSRLPPEPHRVLRSGHLLVEQFEQPAALAGRKSDDLALARGEAWADEQRPLPTLGMDAYHRVDRQQRFGRDLPRIGRVGGEQTAVPAEAVLGAQLAGQAPQRSRQALIGRDEVGPSGVTAVRRDDVSTQDGPGRRIHQRRDVGVPAVVVRHLPRAELRLVTSAVDGQDLRKAGRRLVLIGMGGCELTELRREGDLLGVADRLAAEEDDLPAQEGRADLSDGLVVEVPAQVDAVDLSPGVAGERSDVDPQFVHDRCHRQVLQG